MEKLNLTSPDLVQKNVEAIAAAFPNVITEVKDAQGILQRAVDFDLLRQELSAVLVEGDKERYQLTWPGKRQAILQANAPINKTLRPVKEDSVDWDTTQNIYIEGDNLEALKLLQESYLNKVKCIYIDPPYNTGNDFIYKDDFRQSTEEYLQDSGQVDEEGNRLFQNNESNGRFHSDWLTMMYPRLKLARNLLCDDGVTFISIDDNEADNLKKICKEVFGEDNFVAQIARVAKTTSFKGNFFTPSKDYVLCIAKSKEGLNNFYDIVDHEQYKKIEQDGDRIGEKYRDDTAFYLSTLDITRGSYSQRYWIQCPDGTKVIPPGKTFPPERGQAGDGVWRWNPTTFEEKKHLIVFKKTKQSPLLDENGNQANWNLYTKSYLSDKLENGNVPRDFWESFLNRNGSEALKAIDIPFDYAKPVNLIKYIFTIIGLNKSDIILDFFSGSATTAHAVMQLNAEDGGNRQYIMIQLPEATAEDSEAYKAGYKNICEIGKERIRRAAKKIQEETAADIDYGFRVFRVDTGNMKDVYHSPQELHQDMFSDLTDNIKADRSGEDLLIQVMLACGLPLSLPMQTKEVMGQPVYYVAENSLVACFAEKVPEELVRLIAKDKPLRVVFRDSSFASDAARINVEEIFKALSPTTEIKVL